MTRRIVVANEYDLERNLERFREGRYARHLLFGVQLLLPPTWSPVLVGESLPGRLNKRAVRIVVTNLRAAWRGTPGAVVYSTYTYGALLAGLLRRVGRRPARVVTVVHGLPDWLRRRPALCAWVYAGHDGLAFLNPRDLAVLQPHLRAHQQGVFLPWGPSRDWLGQPATAERDPGSAYVLVVGKSKRDWDTLLRAHALRRFPLVVVGGADCPVQPGPDIVVHRPTPGHGEALPLAEFRRICREATVVVLPLLESSTLNGLTALGEALSTGVPVVMSGTAAMTAYGEHYRDVVRMVPVGDPRALADAVVQALQEPSRPVHLAEPPTAEAAESVITGLLAG